jgi:hypothetical protein
MKNKVLALIAVLCVSEFSTAAQLFLSGTVPDKGVKVDGNSVEPVSNTRMKIYASERGNGKRIEILRPTKIAEASFIKVVAP